MHYEVIFFSSPSHPNVLILVAMYLILIPGWVWR